MFGIAIGLQVPYLYCTYRVCGFSLNFSAHICGLGLGGTRWQREGRKLHNEEFNGLYCSPDIVRVIKSRRLGWVGHVARMGERRGVYRVLMEKPEGNSPLGRSRRR